MNPAPLELWLGDVVRLRRAHPCGATTWQVVRLGADIGLACQGCGRRVLLERRRLEDRFAGFEARGDPAISRAIAPIARDAVSEADASAGHDPSPREASPERGASTGRDALPGRAAPPEKETNA